MSKRQFEHKPILTLACALIPSPLALILPQLGFSALAVFLVAAFVGSGVACLAMFIVYNLRVCVHTPDVYIQMPDEDDIHMFKERSKK